MCVSALTIVERVFCCITATNGNIFLKIPHLCTWDFLTCQGHRDRLRFWRLWDIWVLGKSVVVLKTFRDFPYQVLCYESMCLVRSFLIFQVDDNHLRYLERLHFRRLRLFFSDSLDSVFVCMCSFDTWKAPLLHLVEDTWFLIQKTTWNNHYNSFLFFF